MPNSRKRFHRRGQMLAVLAALLVPGSPAIAQVVTTVKGKVMDPDGKPLEKVEVLVEVVDVEGRAAGLVLKPVKTKKDGSFTYPFLDPGQYKVYPRLEGYLVVQEEVLSIDSQKSVRMDQTVLINRDQKNLPAIPVAPQGQGALVSGKCQVDITVAKEEDFSEALVKLQRGKEAPAEPAAAPTVTKKRDAVERGDEFFVGGDYDQAAATYQEAIDADPSRADAHLGLGKTLLKKGDLTGAQTVLLKAAQLDPQRPFVHFYLATLYHDMGQDKAAIDALEKERAITPDREDILMNLQSLYRDTRQYEKAREILEKITQLNPENTDAHMGIADVYNALGQTQKAEEIYRAILSKNPGQEDVIWYNIGVNAHNADKKQEAAVAFQKAVDANPKNPDAQAMLGWALVGLGKAQDAVPHFREYLKLEPKGKHAQAVGEFLKTVAKK